MSSKITIKFLIGIMAVLFCAVLFLNGCNITDVLNETPTKTIVIDTESEPASPLKLVLTVQLFAPQRQIAIQAEIKRHPGYPEDLFSLKTVQARVNIEPQVGIKLEGEPTWKAVEGISGNQVKRFTKIAHILQDGKWSVTIWITGESRHPATQFDSYSDIAQFFILSKDRILDINTQPFGGSGPGEGEPEGR